MWTVIRSRFPAHRRSRSSTLAGTGCRCAVAARDHVGQRQAGFEPAVHPLRRQAERARRADHLPVGEPGQLRRPAPASAPVGRRSRPRSAGPRDSARTGWTGPGPGRRPGDAGRRSKDGPPALAILGGLHQSQRQGPAEEHRLDPGLALVGRVGQRRGPRRVLAATGIRPRPPGASRAPPAGRRATGVAGSATVGNGSPASVRKYPRSGSQWPTAGRADHSSAMRREQAGLPRGRERPGPSARRLGDEQPGRHAQAHAPGRRRRAPGRGVGQRGGQHASVLSRVRSRLNRVFACVSRIGVARTCCHTRRAAASHSSPSAAWITVGSNFLPASCGRPVPSRAARSATAGGRTPGRSSGRRRAVLPRADRRAGSGEDRDDQPGDRAGSDGGQPLGVAERGEQGQELADRPFAAGG